MKRIVIRAMAQEIISPDTPLPGIVPDETQTHPPCVTKGIKCDEEYGQGEDLGVSSVDRFGINRKLSFFKWFIGYKGKNTTVEKVMSENNLGVTNENNQSQIELKVFPTRQPYVPYALAVSYITKITKDMYQMQHKHKQIIKQMDFIRKEEKNDHIRKIKTLKRIFEAYHDHVRKKNEYWQDTVKDLLKRNDELMEENRNLLHQANQVNEKWEREKSWFLETFTQKMNFLHTPHSLTAQELREIIVDIEEVQEHLKLVYDHQNSAVSTGKMIAWDWEVETEQENENKFGNAVNTVAEGENTPLQQHVEGALVILEKMKQAFSKRERAIKEISQRESEPRLNVSQETINQLLKILVSTIHIVYHDIPAAQQRIDQLLTRNDAETPEHKKADNYTSTNTLPHEAFCNDILQDLRKPIMTKTFLNHQDLQEITLDCIRNGKVSKLSISDNPPSQIVWGPAANAVCGKKKK